jgi:outer membrane receptor protein involved in Fe transport
MPSQKVTLTGNYSILEKLNLNSSIILVGKRYGYFEVDDNGPVAGTLDPYTVWNFFLNFQALKGFTIGAGIYDVLNQKPPVPQAYNGGVNGIYPPIPGRTREYVIKLSYQFIRNK